MKADNNSKGGMILGHNVLAAFRKGMQPPILESDDYQDCIIQLSLDLVEGTVGGGEGGKGGGKTGRRLHPQAELPLAAYLKKKKKLQKKNQP